MSEEDVPFDVLDDFPETGDLTDQTGNDVIDAFQKVRFVIKNVTPKVSFADEAKTVKKTAGISLRVAIDSLGVDGEGKYKNKNLFQDLTTYVNREILTSDWWQKNAMFPYKTFLKAIGFDFANPPKINDAFIASLKDKPFVADIKKKAIQVKNEDGKWIGTGEFRNELINFKAAE